jgi:hypothetical protein
MRVLVSETDSQGRAIVTEKDANGENDVIEPTDFTLNVTSVSLAVALVVTLNRARTIKLVVIVIMTAVASGWVVVVVVVVVERNVF